MAKELIGVIATAGRPKLLRQTLEFLSQCERPANYGGIIVVENGGRAGGEEIVRAYRTRLDTRYVYVSEGNKSNALNHVLQMVDNSLIFFTDDDVKVHPGILVAYSDAAAGMEGGQFYGGPVGADYEYEPTGWLKEFLLPDSRDWWLGEEARAVTKGIFLGFNWSAFAKDLRNAGGFDRNRGPGALSESLGQETEMQARLLRNGVKGVYVPQAMVWHYVPRERCSQGWAAQRAYRWGIQNGIDYVDAGPKLFGVPRWMYRTWIENAFNLIITSVGNDEKSRFHAYHKFRFFCGYMRGSRIAHKGLHA